MAGKSAAALVLAVSALALTMPALADAHAATAAQGDAPAPGARGWISQKLLDYVANDMTSLVIDRISHMHIPDESGEEHSIQYEFNNFVVKSVGLAPSLRFVAGQGLSISIAQIQATITCNWKYREKHRPHIPHGSGTADIHIDSGTRADGVLVPGVDATSHPTIGLSSLHVNVDLGKITIHGSLLDWLYKELIKLVKGKIQHSVADGVNDAISGFVADDLAKKLAALPLQLPLALSPPFDVALFDVSFDALEVPTADHLLASVRGAVLSRNASDPAYPVPPPPLPATPPGSFAEHMLSLTLNDWVLNSAAWLFYSKGLLAVDVAPSDVPTSSPLQLNTDSLLLLAPNLTASYPHANLTLHVSAAAPPTVHFDRNNRSHFYVHSDARLRFDVLTPTGPVDAFTLGAPLNFSATVSVSDASPQAATARVDVLSVTPLTVVESSVGHVHTHGVSSTLRLFLDLGAIPRINAILGAGMPIPPVDGVSFERLALTIDDGALTLRTDLSYSPTETLPVRAAALV